MTLDRGCCFLPIFLNVKDGHEETASPEDRDNNAQDKAVLQAPEGPEVGRRPVILDCIRDLEVKIVQVLSVPSEQVSQAWNFLHAMHRVFH